MMPPKSKGFIKSDWQECDRCQCLISATRYQTKHSEACGEDVQNFLATTPDYGFIRDRVLYGIALITKEGSDWKLNRPDKDSVIFLHISAMKLCGISIGQPVVVNSSHVLHAWPSTAVMPPGVGFTQGGLNIVRAIKDQLVSIMPIREDTLPATEVMFTVSDWADYMDSHSFTSHIQQQFNNRHLAVNQIMCMNYFGRQHQLLVTKITGADGSTSIAEGEIPELETVTQQLGQLSVSPVKNQSMTSERSLDCSVSFTDTSTPVKPRHDGKEKSHDTLQHTPRSHDCKQSHETSTALNMRTVHDLITASQNMPQFHRVDSSTKFCVKDFNRTHSSKQKGQFTTSQLGGLEKQIRSIKEVIDLKLKNPHMLAEKGLRPPQGLLLYGPSGTGKTCLAHALAIEADVHVIIVNGPEVFSKFYGEAEAKLTNIFTEAKKRAPSIVFIDEIDALCPRRENVHNEVEKRVVASLLSQLDALDTGYTSQQVLVICATNKRDNLDPALRRPGRIDKEIEIGVPSASDRVQILHQLLEHVTHTLHSDDIEDLGLRCHGYVGADLSALCKEAGMHALKRLANQVQAAGDAGINNVVTLEDMTFALQVIQPSAMREVAIEVPQVSWADIGGQAELKLKLKQAVEWPLKHPEAFKRLGIRPPRGLLMYGPPGCSKTMIAKALARESGLNFIAIKGPELFNKWVGESERAVREVFRRARAAAPAIVFFDEIDALAVERGSGGSNVADRVLAQLLTEIDGVDALQDVTIVAATNRPDRIDKALLRPGRLDRIVYVPLPDTDTRKEILNIQLKKTPVAEDVTVDDLVHRTEGYSGAEVCALFHEAAMCAMKEDINATQVSKAHFQVALQAVTPRLSKEMIDFYEKYHKANQLQSV